MGLAVVVDEALAEDDLSVAWYLGLDAAPVASLSEGAARPRLHRSGADARFKNSV
jgi:hypothetical protein